MNCRLIDIVLILIHISSISLETLYECDSQTVPCGCGYRNVVTSGRIVDGEAAVPLSWSMVVSLQCDVDNDGTPSHCCGGTILSDSYILTAAHCVRSELTSSLINVTVVAGIHAQSDTPSSIRNVDKIFIHPEYIGIANNRTHDIAILRLSEPLNLNLNPYLARTCRPPLLERPVDSINYPSNGTSLTAVGWGRLSTWDELSNELQQVNLFSIHHNQSTCANVIHDIHWQFCAGVYGGGKGVCYGDSGGPILRWIGDRWEQMGIVSYGKDGCASPSYQSVFVRLASYNNWIDSIILETEPPKPETYICDNTLASCGCSYNHVELTPSRIVGGEEAIPNSWSMMVSLRYTSSDSHFCGGSILSDFYILTAAHCVESDSPSDIYIIAGIHNKSDDNGIIRQVDKIIVHPLWYSPQNLHDIAILHLSQPLNIADNSKLTRTCLPHVHWPSNIEEYPSSGTRLAAVGWGNLRQSIFDNSPDNLHQVQVFAIDNEDSICNNSIYNTDIQFCAGLHDGGKDACQGDSGGPILQWLYNRWEQVGITSYGRGCAVAGNPGVYTRLAYYYEWIQSIITTPTAEIFSCNNISISCGCGYNNVLLTPSRIVGGEDAAEGSWSMAVSLRFAGTSHRCGGTLLSESFILTAAHCVATLSIGSGLSLTVAAGMTNRSDPRQIIREVDQIYVHPNYTTQTRDYRHDIAVLHVKNPFEYTSDTRFTKSCVRRIDPPSLTIHYPRNGSRLAVIGWGLLRSNGFYLPEMLQQVQVYTIDNDHPACADSIFDSQVQFCAGLIQGGKDSCLGDSGGPIFQWTGNYWEQVGIVSYGYDCAEPGYPGIYTRLSYYYDWINDILQNQGEHLEPSNGTTTTTTTGSMNSTRPPPTTSTSNGNKNYQNIFLVELILLPVHALFSCCNEF